MALNSFIRKDQFRKEAVPCTEILVNRPVGKAGCALLQSARVLKRETFYFSFPHLTQGSISRQRQPILIVQTATQGE